MHDIRLIRDDPAAFDAALGKRGFQPLSPIIQAFDDDQRRLKSQLESERQSRKILSEQYRSFAAANRADAFEAQKIKSKAMTAAREIENIENRIAQLPSLDDYLATIPNLPSSDVPRGQSEEDNVEVEVWGERRTFDFEARDHEEIGRPLGLDFETAAKISGARFSFMRGQVARLHRGLGQFMLDQQVESGFLECNPPLLVKDEALFGTAQLPKFMGDLFVSYLKPDITALLHDFIAFHQKNHGNDLAKNSESDFISRIAERMPQAKDRRSLIPTSEVSLTNSVRDSVLNEGDLPLRLTALTPCFRSEAGAAGRDTKGMIRQHQFEKVELVTICRPEESQSEHQKMVVAAERILHALHLPFRKVLLCAGDMGFSARKTYDLEVWLPSQRTYREISSISNCGDFQARRMKARFRRAGQKGTEFVHTLNGSGLAVGRTLVAVLENYQEADGSVSLPQVLHPYMGGVTRLIPD